MSCARSLGSLLTCGFPTRGLSLFCFFNFASGAFHKLTGDSLIVLEGTVGRCCQKVTDTINSLPYTKSKRKRTPQNQNTLHRNLFLPIGHVDIEKKNQSSTKEIPQSDKKFPNECIQNIKNYWPMKKTTMKLMSL